MTLRSQPALEFTGHQLAEALTASFQGYLLPVRMNALGFETRFRAEHLDPAASQLWFSRNDLVGAVLVARRGWSSRIAAMGVTPSYRGRGHGRAMLGAALEAARERGDTQVTLEVFEQNPAARSLYESLGFRSARRLVGYSRAANPLPSLELQPMDPLEFSRLAARYGQPDLPWMLAPESFAGMRAPAFTLGGKVFALAQDAPERFILWGLIVPPSERRQGWGQRLVRALEAHFAKGCRLVQIVPDDLEPGFFGRLGFQVDPLWQHEMRLEFGA